MAIDITLTGLPNIDGDGCVANEMVAIGDLMHDEGFFWGKDFSVEESGHFEISEQKAQEWINQGKKYCYCWCDNRKMDLKLIATTRLH
jgi:hypothetical protein